MRKVGKVITKIRGNNNERTVLGLATLGDDKNVWYAFTTLSNELQASTVFGLVWVGRKLDKFIGYYTNTSEHSQPTLYK